MSELRAMLCPILSVDHPHGSDESVSLPDHGLEKARAGGVVAQGGANLSHNVVDVALGIDEQVRAPEFPDDVLAGHHLVASSDQKNQQFHWLLFERDPLPCPAKLIAAQVQLDRSRGFLSPSHEALRRQLSRKSRFSWAIHKRYTKVTSSSLPEPSGRGMMLAADTQNLGGEVETLSVRCTGNACNPWLRRSVPDGRGAICYARNP